MLTQLNLFHKKRDYEINLYFFENKLLSTFPLKCIYSAKIFLGYFECNTMERAFQYFLFLDDIIN